METLYGILSDLHKSSPLVAKAAFQRLKGLGAQGFILNGDINGSQNGILPPQHYLQFVLKEAADTGLETFVQFGSHEELLPSEEVLKHSCSLYGNIIDVAKHRRVEKADHHLVFLPGSDTNAGGEYTFGKDMPSGSYVKTKEGLIPFENRQQLEQIAQREKEIQGLFRYENMGDLQKYVTEPGKTILVCHVPALSAGAEAVDRAEFGIVNDIYGYFIVECHDGTKDQIIVLPEAMERTQERLDQRNVKEILDKRTIEPGSIFPLEYAKKEIEKGAPISIINDNRGNKELADLIRQLGITKAINGHFHESAHRAHDLAGTAVPENTFTPSLLWNASYMDGMKAGILRVNGDQAAYQNIDLRK